MAEMLKSSDIGRAQRLIATYQIYRHHYDGLLVGASTVFLRSIVNGCSRDFDDDPFETIARDYLHDRIIGIEEELASIGVEIEDSLKPDGVAQ